VKLAAPISSRPPPLTRHSDSATALTSNVLMRRSRSVWDMQNMGLIFNATLPTVNGSHNIHFPFSPQSKEKRRLRVERVGLYLSPAAPEYHLRQIFNFRFRVVCIAYPMHTTHNRKESLFDVLPVSICSLLSYRETLALTTQSDPVLPPMQNGPCRGDVSLRWEYLF